MFGLTWLLILIPPAALLKLNVHWLLLLDLWEPLLHRYTLINTHVNVQYTSVIPLAAIWEHIWSPFGCWRYCYGTVRGEMSPVRGQVCVGGASQHVQYKDCSVDLSSSKLQKPPSGLLWAVDRAGLRRLWRCLCKIWGFLNTGRLQWFCATEVFKARDRGGCGICWRLFNKGHTRR